METDLVLQDPDYENSVAESGLVDGSNIGGNVVLRCQWLKAPLCYFVCATKVNSAFDAAAARIDNAQIAFNPFIRNSMSRRPLVGLLSVALLTVASGAAVSLGLFRHRTTPAELETLFRDRIPLGSSSRRVEAFLDSVGIHHSEYIAHEREIFGIWRRTSVGLVSEKSIKARFWFDENHRLVRYQLEEVRTDL